MAENDGIFGNTDLAVNALIKPLINVGALFDIPTGRFRLGPKGEYYLNGGLGGVVGVVGMPNNFKSTIQHYLMLSAANRMNASGIIAPMHTYDTEDNMLYDLDKYNILAERFEYIPEEPLYQGAWAITSKSKVDANKWFSSLVKTAKTLQTGKKLKYPHIVSKMTKKPIELPPPSFVEIDSLTELESASTLETLEKKGLEDTNTLYMAQGLVRSKLVKKLPEFTMLANMYFLATAHLGNEFNIASGPFAPQPKKQLSFLKQGDKIKGVPEKFLFLSTHFWYAHSSKVLKNQNTGLPEYPIEDNDVETDLHTVTLTQLRSKTGPSGFSITLVASQREGILPSLTEFHFLKENKFGIDGNPRSYWLDIYPDVKLSRTTVRKKINEDPKLRRALNITAELLQMMKFMPIYKNYYMTPKELYEAIKKQGYDWNEILETRGWWTIDNYNENLPPFLSTLDLLRMAKGEYVPYWKKDKKKGDK